MAVKKIERVKGAKPGGTILSAEGLDLDFTSGRGPSVYARLLEQLLDAPAASQFAAVRCEMKGCR